MLKHLFNKIKISNCNCKHKKKTKKITFFIEHIHASISNISLSTDIFNNNNIKNKNKKAHNNNYYDNYNLLLIS